MQLKGFQGTDFSIYGDHSAYPDKRKLKAVLTDNMDRNQLIGIVLILAMLVGYQLLVPKPAPEKEPVLNKRRLANQRPHRGRRLPAIQLAGRASFG